MQLYNDDFFKILPTLKPKSIDLVVVDLPFNQTSCRWDQDVIDLDKMWLELKRICKKKCIYVFFCTTKFGFNLIKSNTKWFRYDLVWQKSRKVGFLSANKMPLRSHEMLYVFSDNDEDKTGLNNNLEEYSKKLFKAINKSKKEIKKEIGDMSHFFGNYGKKQFRLPSEIKYNLLIEKYNINKLTYFLTHDEMKKLYEQGTNINIYNPQMKEGKPYSTKESSLTNSYYRGGEKEYKSTAVENKGTRHPDSILKYDEPNHKMLYVFGGDHNAEWDLDINSYKNLREYAKRLFNDIKITDKKLRNLRFFKHDKKDFCLIRKDTYKQLIDNYKINKLKYFITFKELQELWKEQKKNIKKSDCSTYNPQKIKGKPYKVNMRKCGIYTDKVLKGYENKSGYRHPSTILTFKNPVKPVHRTQKPIKLCEFLVKSYSNEGDTVLDFTMGSGTTGIACLNTKRNFIGIEKDKEIFELANMRINHCKEK